MRQMIKLIPGLVAVLFLLMGINFLFNPVAAAEQVGLTPLGIDGMNTIRSDFAGLFLTCALLLVAGIWRSEGTWLLAVAVLMLVIAAGRVVGFVVDGSPGEAPLTAFVFELLIAAGLIYASGRLRPAADGIGAN